MNAYVKPTSSVDTERDERMGVKQRYPHSCPIWCLYFDRTHDGPCITEDDVDEAAP